MRYHAPALMHSLTRADDEAVVCRIESVETTPDARRRPCLFVSPLLDQDVNTSDADFRKAALDAAIEKYQPLLGTYCDITLHLGETRYLFSTDVLGVEMHNDAVQIQIARPTQIQVAQRRRFWRFGLAQSSQVQMTWSNPDGGVGWLCNVSPDGLACRGNTRVADQLGIGEQLRVEFSLAPGDPEHFALQAVLCNKTPAGTKNTMILGMQFLKPEEHDENRVITEKLKQRLVALHNIPAQNKQGGRP